MESWKLLSTLLIYQHLDFPDFAFDLLKYITSLTIWLVHSYELREIIIQGK